MKPDLRFAAGLYLHADQCAPLCPAQGLPNYQDLPPEKFGSYASWRTPFAVKASRRADWGSGSYLIGPDGTLTLACFSYDSSD